MSGPRVRTDIVDVFVFRGEPAGAQLLLLHRAKEPMRGSWHPIMGHVRDGETAAACALRELEEEVGLTRNNQRLLGLWQLEQVHPYFLADRDEIVLSPRFAAEVAQDWEPTLDDEHDAHRWIAFKDAPAQLQWPGQRAVLAEIQSEIMPLDSKSREALRIPTER